MSGQTLVYKVVQGGKYLVGVAVTGFVVESERIEFVVVVVSVIVVSRIEVHRSAISTRVMALHCASRPTARAVTHPGFTAALKTIHLSSTDKENGIPNWFRLYVSPPLD